MVSEQRHRSTSCGRCRFIPRGCTSRRLVLQLSERQPCSIVMLQASPICAEAVNTHSLRTSTFKPQTCFFCKRKATIQSRKICSYVAKPDVGGAVRPQNFRQDNKKTKLNKDHKHSRQEGVLEAKRALQFATAGTFRGGLVTPTQRAVIEEAIIDIEAYGRDIDFQQLQGLWRLIYTTALDVAPLVMPSSPFSPVRIGNIYQRFGSLESGLCQNIIKASVPFVLEEDDGVTLCVGVNYEASSPRRIALRFQEAGFSDVHITPLTEAFIAPALLPRGWIQQQILLAIKEANLKIPLPFASRQGRSGVGEYLLSFLDDNMLVGRAQNGTFVFIRDQ